MWSFRTNQRVVLVPHHTECRADTSRSDEVCVHVAGFTLRGLVWEARGLKLLTPLRRDSWDVSGRRWGHDKLQGNPRDTQDMSEQRNDVSHSPPPEDHLGLAPLRDNPCWAFKLFWPDSGPPLCLTSHLILFCSEYHVIYYSEIGYSALYFKYMLIRAGYRHWFPKWIWFRFTRARFVLIFDLIQYRFS